MSNRIHPVSNCRGPRWVRLVLWALGILLVAGSAIAQDSARRSTAMREKVYDKLSKAQEATETENWDKAFD